MTIYYNPHSDELLILRYDSLFGWVFDTEGGSICLDAKFWIRHSRYKKIGIL